MCTAIVIETELRVDDLPLPLHANVPFFEVIQDTLLSAWLPILVPHK